MTKPEFIDDPEIVQIIERYAREVIEESNMKTTNTEGV